MSGEHQAVYGTAQTVIDLATDITSTYSSGAPAAEFDNTSDAVVPHALYGLAVLSMPDWAGAPTAGSSVDLYMIRKNVDGTNDDTGAPSGAAVNGGEWCATFPVYAADELQRRTKVISLLGVITADFYIKNNSGQTMNNDAGTNCILKITPFSLKPKA